MLRPCHRRGEGKMERSREARQQGVCLSMKTMTENFFSHSFLRKLVAFCYIDFFTALCFVNQRSYKMLTMQAHALTCACYLCGLCIIILFLIVYRDGLGSSFICATTSQSSCPCYMCICDSHPSSDLCCGHNKSTF
jgi:hypothetical protein